MNYLHIVIVNWSSYSSHSAGPCHCASWIHCASWMQTHAPQLWKAGELVCEHMGLCPLHFTYTACTIQLPQYMFISTASEDAGTMCKLKRDGVGRLQITFPFLLGVLYAPNMQRGVIWGHGSSPISWWWELLVREGGHHSHNPHPTWPQCCWGSERSLVKLGGPFISHTYKGATPHAHFRQLRARGAPAIYLSIFTSPPGLCIEKCCKSQVADQCLKWSAQQITFTSSFFLS